MKTAAMVLLALTAPLAGQVAPIGAAEFDALFAQVVPKPEAWESIGWRTDLSEAREAAVKLRRPIFLWAMNGHPLGCT